MKKINVTGFVAMLFLFTFSREGQVFSSTGFTLGNQANYAKECSACHMAYSPGLLPESSWKSLMTPENLADHFGENAELDEAIRLDIETYLVSNAADRSSSKISRKIVSSIRSSQAPQRITQVPYIVRKHDEVPSQYIKKNEKVGSLSHCDACHPRAEQNEFDEDSVILPGYGRWD